MTGKVYLVGAGPGDPELLTVKAVRLLARADVVLHDGLVTNEILALANQRARVIDVGKRCGNKLLTQSEINQLLIALARKVHLVVRLKGGDPAIFGRVGEEIAALVEAEVPYEIVPGITSATAAAAAAGISLTDRRLASSVVFVTAHRATGLRATDWNRMVSSGSTLVIYMPGTEYGWLSEQLSDAGLPPETPCVLVSNAARAHQKIVRTQLAELDRVARSPAPVLMIVGECANPAREAALTDIFVSQEFTTSEADLRIT